MFDPFFSTRTFAQIHYHRFWKRKKKSKQSIKWWINLASQRKGQSGTRSSSQTTRFLAGYSCSRHPTPVQMSDPQLDHPSRTLEPCALRLVFAIASFVWLTGHALDDGHCVRVKAEACLAAASKHQLSRALSSSAAWGSIRNRQGTSDSARQRRTRARPLSTPFEALRKAIKLKMNEHAFGNSFLSCLLWWRALCQG